METQALLTIIIPIYNAEKYLRACLESVCAQNYKPVEIILIDDGSTDSSAEICDEFANKDTRIQVFHIENAGAAAARNFGIQKMHGKYLAFVDADDKIRPDIYTHLIQVLENKHVHMAIGTWCIHNEISEEQHDADLTYYGKLSAKELKKIISIENVKCGGGFPWNRVIDYAYIKEKANHDIYFPENLYVYEDKCWVLELCKHIDLVYISKVVCYDYYEREGSLSRKNDFNRCMNKIMAWEKIVSLNDDLEPSDLKGVLSQFRSYCLETLWNYRNADDECLDKIWEICLKLKQYKFNSIKQNIKFCFIQFRMLKKYNRNA